MTCIVFDPDTVAKIEAILLYTLAQLTIIYFHVQSLEWQGVKDWHLPF